jgi:predicted permease
MRDWRRIVHDHLPPLRVTPERENEIVTELALQCEQAYKEALASGLAESDAAARAESDLGDWNQLATEINRAERPAPPPLEASARGGLFTGALHDVRHAVRFLRRSPLLATLAILTLAFGIGANTAIFTFVDAIVLRALPYEQPDRLVAIETRRTSQPEIEPWSSAPDFFDMREGSRTLSKAAGISPIWNTTLTGHGGAQRLETLYVSADFFPLLGIHAFRGRLFLPSDDQKTHAANVAVLSYAFWQRLFGGSQEAVGSTLQLDGSAFTVAGVLPPDFRYLGEPLAGATSDIDLWLPLGANMLITRPRGLRFLKVIGRLNPGVSATQANDEIARIGAGLASQYPESNAEFVWDVRPLNTLVTGRSRTTMLLLLGAVGLVLVMACANVAHLLIARAAARECDLAIRIALGASRFRLLRHMLSEGAVLAICGGAAGLVLAEVLLRLIVAVSPASLVHSHVISLDLRALLFSASAAILSALLAGLPPAFRVIRSETAASLRQGGRSLTSGNHRLRAALVVLQTGLALSLLIGAGLLIHSFVRLLDVNPGFDARHLLTLSTQAPPSFRTPEQLTGMYRSVHDRLLELPTVKDVAAVSRLPLLGADLGAWLYREGVPTSAGQPPDIEFRVATLNYFSTMGIPLRKGRMFDDHDIDLVAVIDEVAAAKYWPGEDPIGKRVKVGPNTSQPWTTIVGVVGAVHHSGLGADPQPHIYRPYSQSPLFSPIFVVRTAADPAPLINPAIGEIHGVNQDIPVYSAFAMQSLVDRSAAQKRFVMWLLTGFAIAAMLLAMIGMYGTISQSVVQRTPEIGVRIALGASPSAAVRLILSEGLRLTAVGILLGTVASLALTRLMRSILFEVQPLDPLAFFAAAVTLAAFAILACYLPARRVSRIDPMSALRING